MASNAPDQPNDLKPRLLVIGVGGAGCNAVDNMIRSNLQGVDFISANTDAQALTESLADKRIQLGPTQTRGLGAGSQVATGKAAAEESIDEIRDLITGHNMVFITAGMGGGTGTGASPVIAQIARDLGILTLGVVTKPFNFEGPQRMRIANEGIAELEKHVDTMIVIPNQNLFLIADHKTSFLEAFNLADDVLYSAVRGVTDLIVMPGLVNLDFADIKIIMQETGNAMMGTGEAEGEGRALKAAEDAIKNPLLESSSVVGAQGLLINITGGNDLMLHEVDDVSNRISQEVGENCFTIFGSALDSKLDGKIRVYVVATGMPDADPSKTPPVPRPRPRSQLPQPIAPAPESTISESLISETPVPETPAPEISNLEYSAPQEPEQTNTIDETSSLEPIEITKPESEAETQPGTPAVEEGPEPVISEIKPALSAESIKAKDEHPSLFSRITAAEDTASINQVTEPPTEQAIATPEVIKPEVTELEATGPVVTVEMTHTLPSSPVEVDDPEPQGTPEFEPEPTPTSTQANVLASSDNTKTPDWDDLIPVMSELITRNPEKVEAEEKIPAPTSETGTLQHHVEPEQAAPNEKNDSESEDPKKEFAPLPDPFIAAARAKMKAEITPEVIEEPKSMFSKFSRMFGRSEDY